ncbi:MAG: 5-oxoprolinase subunit PxpB [Acidobacteriota bacterium]
MSVRFLPCGDTAIAVEFGDRIDRALSNEVLALRSRIRSANIRGVVETVPTYRSLLIHYDPLQTSASEIIEAAQNLVSGEATIDRTRHLWRVPVCYEGDFAPDLADVAEQTGLRPDQVVSLHAATRYHVYMVGFLPGYPYMGDVPAPLTLPRRSDPRIRVPPGSVAIATTMTAIYPVESPGGWHLIGRTPIRIFDPRMSPPALFAPGDAVEFEPIDAEAFARLRSAAESGDYRLSRTELAA